jgi:integrase
MANIEKRVSDKGVVTFRAKVRLKGIPAQSATFKRLTDARKWAQQTESAIQEGRHFKTSEAKRHTFGELVDRYMRDILPAKKDAQNRATHFVWWKEELGDFSLAEVMPPKLAECRDMLARETTSRGNHKSPATVNRYLASLSHAFSIAVREWGWLEENPLRKVSKAKEPRGRIRYLLDDERERLLVTCRESRSPDLYSAVVLALSTGARKMELLGMRWGQVDFKRCVITLHDTKNNERRVLPLTSHALEIMRERGKAQHVESDLVFPGKNSKNSIDLRTPWQTALRQAEIEDFRWHDLRHSTASYLAMNGASLAEIAEVLGHKTLQMVKRYAHLGEAHTAKVVESMNNKIFGDV